MSREHAPTGKKIIIIGASSGIGRELALRYLERGHTVGITGRRAEKLDEIRQQYPHLAHAKIMDVRSEESLSLLDELIRETRGVDLFIYNAGTGSQSKTLLPDIEMDTLHTNAVGFTRLVIRAYNHFKASGAPGHIAVISSIAGIKPLDEAPAYSATKRYVTHYTSCLARKARRENIPLTFTTILPGFIRTELLQRDYPLSISLEKGARLIFRAIERGKRSVILPGRWRPIMLLARLIPGRLWEKM
ncbi:MAG: SDR family NAD(P)-dependent oxidoreductase [Odoribacteraceae bacterium]|jgi:short-subunit dehydrogenase|nr:SDR family NAD(P)-dependent oxidoreductase [Odoribacteraceae bacterium]